MVSYIVDEAGKKTHAVIPINDWNSIVDELNDKNAKAIIDGTLNLNNGTNKTVIPSIISSVSILTMLDSPTFLKGLEELFWFVKSASPSEIGFMYLLRTDEFAEYIYSEFNEENIKKLHVDFHITDLQGIPLSLEKSKKLQSIVIDNTSLDAVLKEFRVSYMIGAKNNQKRVRRDAEIKRFFIFDALDYLPKVFPDLVMDIDAYKYELSIHLYPDNTKESAMAQLNKAHREAKDRIYSNQWIEYLGQ